MKRRLNEAQAELERLRAEASAAGTSPEEAVSAEAPVTGGAAEAQEAEDPAASKRRCEDG
ncbi:MAG: hypothetical protein ACXVVQ_22230 [Solirubrobacteraceae bacterium]